MSDLSIPDIVAAVQADIQARGFPTTTVFYGDWKASKHNGANQVIFGLRGFELTDPLGPGPYFQDPVAKTSQARALYTRVQACQVWVHAAPPVPEGDQFRAEKCQVATCALLHAVIAALWRLATGSLSIGTGEWPRPEKQQFVYGALATFIAKFSIPVLDDSFAFVNPNASASTGTAYLVVGGNHYQASKTP